MSDFENSLAKHLTDSDFKEAFKATEENYQITRALIAARLDSNMTQKELAAKSGIRQSNISRIESGNCIPTLNTLYALAEGMGKKLVIEFI